MVQKFKKTKLRSALTKLQTTHTKRQRATEIRDQKEAAMAIAAKQQSKTGNSTQTHKQQIVSAAQKRAMAKFPPPPFYDNDTILLIGEANFSFSKSLALEILNRGDIIVATSLDSFKTMMEKYPLDGQNNVKELEDAGATVLFEVDGTKLEKMKALKGKRFSKIVFNFPHAGAGIKDQDRNVVSNQKLMRSFFESAVPFLSDPKQGDVKAGEIHVTVKTGLPYDLWNIKRLATGTGLLGNKTSFPFRPEQYPGYEHRRTIGFKEGVSQGENIEIKDKKPKTFVFVKKQVKEEDLEKEQEAANLKKRKRAGEDVSEDEDDE